MSKYEIHFSDWHRWLLGQDPWIFSVEVLLRTLLILILLMLAVRLMNNRMAGQITVTELSVMVTLGAIVSPVMQLPDRGILFGIVGLGCAVLFQKGVSWLGVKRHSYERWLEGKAALLVEDGHLNLAEMKKSRISRQEIYSVLRQNNIINLGDVKRMYIEACGIFSIYAGEKKNDLGLPINPSIDPDGRYWTKKAGDGLRACVSCGHVQAVGDQSLPCDVCGSKSWVSAISIIEEEK